MTNQIEKHRLPPGQHLVAPGKWPTIGEKIPRDSNAPWTLTVEGKVTNATTFSLDELHEFPRTESIIDIHCVTRWSKYDVRFSGVLLSDLLDRCEVSGEAKYISFVSRSERSHSSSMTLTDALELKPLIALQVDGESLPIGKGGPIRSIVPGRYFYKSVKWVERIVLMEKDSLGYWEKDAGYHNQADPWQEQRYISATVDKRRAKELIESKDFSGQDLLSIQLAEFELPGLNASEAMMRNANFSNCHLSGADFSRANLSNANFSGANLSGVNFSNTDLEGANLAGADLSSATMKGCSLFGATFCDECEDGSIRNGATFDSGTDLPASAIEILTPTQLNYVQTQINKFR